MYNNHVLTIKLYRKSMLTFQSRILVQNIKWNCELGLIFEIIYDKPCTELEGLQTTCLTEVFTFYHIVKRIK